MLLFMFLLFPVFLTGYCFYVKSTKIVPSIFLGLMSGILLCAFKTFFLYAHRIIPYGFAENVAYLLIRQTLLPVIVLLVLWFVFSRDDMQYKSKAVAPILLSFYLIYLPYSIVTTSEGLYSGYSLFIKPLIFVSMICIISYCANMVVTTFENKKYVILGLFVICLLCSLIIPAIIETCSIIGEYKILQVILILLYFFVAAFVVALPLIKKLLNK